MRKLLHLTSLCCLVVVPTGALTTACSSDVAFQGSSPEAAVPPPAKSDDALPTPIEVPAAKPDAPLPSTMTTIERKFPAARLEDLTATIEPEFRRATETIILAEGTPAIQTLHQMIRTQFRDPFKQGKDAQTYGPESFKISDSGKLDLLVVVDNSTSMADEQVRLASKIDPLLSKIGNTDWQIAVVTTSSPCLRNGGKTIKKSDSDPSAAFQTAVLVPLDNTVVEKGFPMAIKALKGECKGVTTPWLREGSAVGILILSDEDNCGSNPGEGCPGEAGETTQQMLDFLVGPNGIRPPGLARIYGLIDGQNTCGTSAYAAPKYKLAVESTGGTWGRICDADYSTTLQAISTNVSRILKRDFTLTHAPEAGTLVITVDGTPVTTGYTVSGKVLNLTGVNPVDVEMSVSYAYGSVPKHDRFTLGNQADGDTLSVTINGVLEDPSHFSYDASSKEIVFTRLPVDDADLMVTYRLDTPLPKDFKVSVTDMLGEPTLVEVTGVATQAYTFDAKTGMLTLGVAPTDGDEVRVSHRTKSGRVTRYASALQVMADADSVSAVDAATDAAVAVAIDQDDLIFTDTDVIAGRTIKVSYVLGFDPNDLVLILAQPPVAGSINVSVDDPTELSCQDVSVVGQTVSLICPNHDVGKVTVAYKSLLERFEDFVIADAIPENAVWRVLFDDQEVTGFTRVGSTVHVPVGLLAATSIVTVQATFKQD